MEGGDAILKTRSDINNRENISTQLLDELNYDKLSGADITKICMCLDSLNILLVRLLIEKSDNRNYDINAAKIKYQSLLKILES